mmetsp:Transcript_53528/g.165721  ORF Transcript_53528/g.165721 Transcript_53528/m.165721 type:complete len:407 (+) Transcript_53528:256-1476(+)
MLPERRQPGLGARPVLANVGVQVVDHAPRAGCPQAEGCGRGRGPLQPHVQELQVALRLGALDRVSCRQPPRQEARAQLEVPHVPLGEEVVRLLEERAGQLWRRLELEGPQEGLALLRAQPLAARAAAVEDLDGAGHELGSVVGTLAEEHLIDHAVGGPAALAGAPDLHPRALAEPCRPLGGRPPQRAHCVQGSLQPVGPAQEPDAALLRGVHGAEALGALGGAEVEGLQRGAHGAVRLGVQEPQPGSEGRLGAPVAEPQGVLLQPGRRPGGLRLPRGRRWALSLCAGGGGRLGLRHRGLGCRSCRSCRRRRRGLAFRCSAEVGLGSAEGLRGEVLRVHDGDLPDALDDLLDRQLAHARDLHDGYKVRELCQRPLHRGPLAHGPAVEGAGLGHGLLRLRLLEVLVHG